MKTFVIILSHTYPSAHVEAGVETLFRKKFEAKEKRHTIRKNYGYWRQAFDQIEAGLGLLSIREWSGQPYRSKQRVIANLTRKDGIGMELIYKDNQDEFRTFQHRSNSRIR